MRWIKTKQVSKYFKTWSVPIKFTTYTAYLHKMVKPTLTIRRLLPTNCLSPFGQFEGLKFKGQYWKMKVSWKCVESVTKITVILEFLLYIVQAHRTLLKISWYTINSINYIYTFLKWQISINSISFLVYLLTTHSPQTSLFPRKCWINQTTTFMFPQR